MAWKNEEAKKETDRQSSKAYKNGHFHHDTVWNITFIIMTML